MDKDLSQRIQERAYEIWEREGCSGDPEDHWYRVEQELRDGPPASEGCAPGVRTGEDKSIDKLGNFV